MKLAVIDPGHATADRPRAARDRHRRTGRRGRRWTPAVSRPRDAVRRRRARARRRDVHPEAEDLLAGPVGCRRADARQGLAALLRGARRLRAPHGERQRLHPLAGARHPAQHLRLPREVPRLERRRLQLPGRPVRPDLGGPGTAASTGRWSERTPSNYNDNAFAMSAIGNFELVRPSRAMLEAYGALFAWKLSLHGVNAGSTQQWVGSRNFKAINGHRDAASTACPGRYLYAKIPVDPGARGPACRRAGAGDSSSRTWPAPTSRTCSCGGPATGMAFVLPIKQTKTVVQGGQADRHRRGPHGRLDHPERRRLGPRRPQRHHHPQPGQRGALPEAGPGQRQVRRLRSGSPPASRGCACSPRSAT